MYSIKNDLKSLDFYDFIEPKWAHIGTFGAGALGIITPNQMVNVLNADGGLGEHDTTKMMLLNRLYGENFDLNILDYVITLKYMNTKAGNEYMKAVFIEMPKRINLYQYETLCCLDTEFDNLVNAGLSVFVSMDGYYSEETGNQLKDVIPMLPSILVDEDVIVVENLGTFYNDILVNDKKLTLKRGRDNGI